MQGGSPTKLIPETVNKASFNLSSFVEPRSVGYHKPGRVADPLRIDDIEGSRPAAVGFQTKRVTDPICPVYKLPSVAPVSIEEPRPFIRDTLQVDDIAQRKINFFTRKRGLETLSQPIPGAQSVPRTHFSTAVSRLVVDDINK